MTYSCSCDYGEPPDFYSITEPVARKVHRCDECGGPIEPGERHERISGKWEGYLLTSRTCRACLDGPAAWVQKHCPCTPIGDLFRHLEEDVFMDMRGHLPPGVHFKVGRWIVEARRRRVETAVAA